MFLVGAYFASRPLRGLASRRHRTLALCLPSAAAAAHRTALPPVATIVKNLKLIRELLMTHVSLVTLLDNKVLLLLLLQTTFMLEFSN